MAPPKYTPDRNTFIRWIDEGITHQQMADRVHEITGHKVTRAAISVAISGYELSRKTPRYKREVPWRVKTHHKSYPVQMLRLLGARNLGKPLGARKERELNNWLMRLYRQDLIVAYDPDSDQGFFYIDAMYRDHQDPTLPIRRRPIHVGAIDEQGADSEPRECQRATVR